MPPGRLALVLHAHLPYVRHPEYEWFLEEDWLYEAIIETYLPLLRMLDGHANDGMATRMTMSLTPPLVHMLRDDLLQQRFVRHLDNLIELAESEIKRLENQPHLRGLAEMYHRQFLESREFYEKIGRDIAGAFWRHTQEGRLEIITCGITHGFLPLMKRNESVRAQILLARDHYQENFGTQPQGIWLPECAYRAGLDDVLQEAELRWFALDAHGLMFGKPKPRYAVFAPCFTPAGPAAFARDRDSSRQVWSAEEGYPGDPAYRDFYRDIGFDLSKNYLKPFLPPDANKKFTGIKYHRITGRGGHEKEHYVPEWAEAAADAHATHFMQSRAEQLWKLGQAMNVPPLVMSPFDAELFGHWWFEGPRFLDLFIRKSLYDQEAYSLTTPRHYLEENAMLQVIAPAASSWGNKGYYEVWLDDSNAWIYPHLHHCEDRLIEMARKLRTTDDAQTQRVMTQLTRELLLAQSSDWAFLMKTGTAKDYAAKRTSDHLLRFNRLYEQLENDSVDAAFLENCEWRDNFPPDPNWRYYAE